MAFRAGTVTYRTPVRPESSPLQQQHVDWELCRSKVNGLVKLTSRRTFTTMDVEFRNLTYTVRTWLKRGSEKCVLQGVSGKFKAGELTAILGPSGAGKSSLLNVLSGYRKNGLKGELLSGGEPRDERLFRRLSCYLTQEDVLQPLLTVHEQMLFAAKLKMPAKVTMQHRIDTVNDILVTMGLWESRNTKTDVLSGGQKKRLSISLELVNNTPVFFLDEPTSGLDEVSAKNCIRLLHSLSKQGRTVICTLHTPSASILDLLDHVYVISRGKCVYQGPSNAIVNFLDEMRMPCPSHYNPSDYIIELTDDEHIPNISKLSAAVENGKLCWATKTPVIKDVEQIHVANGLKKGGTLDKDFLQHLPDKFARLLKAESVSSWKQFCILMERMMLQIWRNKKGLITLTLHHCLCSILTGLIFFNCANDAKEMFNHLKFCIGIILFHTYTWLVAPSLVFPTEVKLLKKEHFNHWYSLRSYYSAYQISRLPLMLIMTMFFVSVLYNMIGLPAEINRFLLVYLICCTTSIAAEGIGLAIGSVFSVINGAAVGPAVIGPFLGLAVYGFDFAREIHPLMYAVMQTSFMRAGAEAMVLTLFGLNRESLHCDDIFCFYADPRVVLRMVDLHETPVWKPLSYMCGMSLLFRLLCYIGLRYRLSTYHIKLV